MVRKLNGEGLGKTGSLKPKKVDRQVPVKETQRPRQGNPSGDPSGATRPVGRRGESPATPGERETVPPDLSSKIRGIGRALHIRAGRFGVRDYSPLLKTGIMANHQSTVSNITVAFQPHTDLCVLLHTRRGLSFNLPSVLRPAVSGNKHKGALSS